MMKGGSGARCGRGSPADSDKGVEQLFLYFFLAFCI